MWLSATTVVGSITRPWFFRERVDRYLEERAAGREVPEDELPGAVGPSIRYVAALHEAAGVDVISDGEWRRKSYLGIIADMVSGFELHKAFVDDGVHDGYVGYTITGRIAPFDEGLFARQGTRLMAHTSRPVRVAVPTSLPHRAGPLEVVPARRPRLDQCVRLPSTRAFSGTSSSAGR